VKESPYKDKHQWTFYTPKERNHHEQTIIDILTADKVDIFRPMSEIYQIVQRILKNPRMNLTPLATIVLIELDVAIGKYAHKGTAMRKVIKYVRSVPEEEWEFVYTKQF
jgi:hypothetical protein